MRKPTICICENKGADQLRSNCEADQRLCFHYTHSTIPLLSKSKISSLCPSSVHGSPVCVGPSRKPIVGFPTRWLIYLHVYFSPTATQSYKELNVYVWGSQIGPISQTGLYSKSISTNWDNLPFSFKLDRVL